MELFALTGASSTGVWLLKEATEQEFHCSKYRFLIYFSF